MAAPARPRGLGVCPLHEPAPDTLEHFSQTGVDRLADVWYPDFGVGGAVFARVKQPHGTTDFGRASKAEVLDVIGADTARSGGGYGIVTYRKGETVEPENGFDENRWEVCSRGIHFFLTRIEAENYEL